ncbi:MAG: cation-transporting P-type ATPase [Acidimicrobiales bacterium]
MISTWHARDHRVLPRGPWAREAEDVVADLASDASAGLTSDEAERRLQTVGANALRTVEPPSWLRRMIAQFDDPLVLLLLAAVVISPVAWILEGRAARRTRPASSVSSWW